MILTRGDLVKILAKRSNLIFYMGPIVMAICVLILVNAKDLFQFVEICGFGRRGYQFVVGLVCLAISFLAICTFVFLKRLTMPKVVIEYDDNFIYINKTKKEPAIILRFSDIKRVSSDEFVEEDAEFEGITSSISVLRIQTVDRIITVYGIKNCTDVKFALNRLVKNYTKKRMEQYDQRTEQMKR